MLWAPSVRRQNDTPFCYRCSYVLIIIVTFAHVTSIDNDTPFRGFGGFFGPVFLHARVSVTARKAFPKFALVAVT